MSPTSPLVSVLTPVYNGQKYLAQCVESVIRQTYENWHYTIVNNCSTDDTLEIARRYELNDSRITVITNSEFVGLIENHNIAFRHASADSQYCKILSADDWLYPEALEKLIGMAECNPCLGIIQSYAIKNSGVRQTGVSVERTIVNGRDAARMYLLGHIDFTAPSSQLYRASLIRSTAAFFPGENLSADNEACLRSLRCCDIGFIHQVLSFERIHAEAATNTVRELESHLLDRLELLIEYGPEYLSEQEQTVRFEQMLRNYYQMLAVAAINCKGREFWAYHASRTQALGLRLYGARLGSALSLKILDLLLNPKSTAEKVIRRIKMHHSDDKSADGQPQLIAL